MKLVKKKRKESMPVQYVNTPWSTLYLKSPKARVP